MSDTSDSLATLAPDSAHDRVGYAVAALKLFCNHVTHAAIERKGGYDIKLTLQKGGMKPNGHWRGQLISSIVKSPHAFNSSVYHVGIRLDAQGMPLLEMRPRDIASGAPTAHTFRMGTRVPMTFGLEYPHEEDPVRAKRMSEMELMDTRRVADAGCWMSVLDDGKTSFARMLAGHLWVGGRAQKVVERGLHAIGQSVGDACFEGLERATRDDIMPPDEVRLRFDNIEPLPLERLSRHKQLARLNQEQLIQSVFVDYKPDDLTPDHPFLTADNRRRPCPLKAGS